MKSNFSILSLGVKSTLLAIIGIRANAELIKMCLFYKAAGHARTDPILVSVGIKKQIHCTIFAKWFFDSYFIFLSIVSQNGLRDLVQKKHYRAKPAFRTTSTPFMDRSYSIPARPTKTCATAIPNTQRRSTKKTSPCTGIRRSIR